MAQRQPQHPQTLQRPCSNVLGSGRNAPWHPPTQSLYCWSSRHTRQPPAPGTEQKCGGGGGQGGAELRGRPALPLSPGDSGPCEQNSASQAALGVKSLPASVGGMRDVGPTPGGGQGNSSTLAWRIPWTQEPGGLQSMQSQSATALSDSRFHTFSWATQTSG